MTQSDQHQLIQNISQELQNIDPGLDLLNSSSNPSDLNLLAIVTSDQPTSEKGQERENEGGDEEGKEGEGEEKKEEGIETEKDEEELETERERDLEREIESNLQSFIQSLTYHQSQSQPQSEHDSQTEAHLDSLSILSELASNVLPVETHSNSHLPEDQTFHSLLLGSLPQDSQALSSSNDQQHDQFHSIDQHRHAQDLLSALSVLQTHEHAFDPHHSSSLTFDSIFNPSSNPTHKLHQIQFSNSFSSSSSSGNTPRTDLPSATSLDQNHPSAFLDQSTQSDLDTLLFGLSTPSIVDQHQHQNHTDGFDDILLASIDQHLLAQDLSLDMIDNETELALESNEAYSNQIRVLLDQLNLALERGEELESLATHYANTIQQQILTSQSQSQSQSQSPSQSQSQSQSIPTSSTNNNSEVNMVIFAEGSRTVSLPWFKYKFGQDVPVHEDGTKRDRYNSILHQQAWQVGERRKLEEEIILQVKRIKISRERGSNQLTPTVEDVIKYSDQVDWNSISQALPDRSPIECRIQWNQKQNPNLNRTKWQTDEIDKLFEIVKRNEEKDWKSIANQLGKNCS
ncbi:hypothetical protein DFH28DRAFT_207605 [Melampsora americana]|nr:hypothetical protein DFH28DRAFT_207605 [Melampsora americana]